MDTTEYGNWFKPRKSVKSNTETGNGYHWGLPMYGGIGLGLGNLLR